MKENRDNQRGDHQHDQKDVLEQMLADTREIPADNRVPYAFEKRIMAHIKDHSTENEVNLWEQWSQLLWRAVVPCAAVMVLAAVLFAPGKTDAPTNNGNQGGAPALATTEPAEEDENLEGVVMHSLEAKPDE